MSHLLHYISYHRHFLTYVQFNQHNIDPAKKTRHCIDKQRQCYVQDVKSVWRKYNVRFDSFQRKTNGDVRGAQFQRVIIYMRTYTMSP